MLPFYRVGQDCLDNFPSQAANIVSSAVGTAEKTNTIVARFEESSKKIDKVIRSISAIAKQTSLLALNATIRFSEIILQFSA